MKGEGEGETNWESEKNENKSQGGKADRTIHIVSTESFKPDLIIDENCEGSKSFLKVTLINELTIINKLTLICQIDKSSFEGHYIPAAQCVTTKSTEKTKAPVASV